jgi:hypothetical protein
MLVKESAYYFLSSVSFIKEPMKRKEKREITEPSVYFFSPRKKKRRTITNLLDTGEEKQHILEMT